MLKAPVPLTARAGILIAGEISVIVPPPLGLVATCMKLLNEAPVLLEPIFLIVVLNTVGESCVAVCGEIESVIVRSGAVNVAETVQAPVIAPVVYVVPDNEPPQPVAEAVYPAFGVTVKVVLEP